MTQRRDPCALFCKGRDACFSRPNCTFVAARPSCILAKLVNTNVHEPGPSRDAVPRTFHNHFGLSQFLNFQQQHSHLSFCFYFPSFHLFYAFFHCFLRHFIIISHQKMGPFHSFKSIRVPHLHHFPRFSLKTIIKMIMVE